MIACSSRAPLPPALVLRYVVGLFERDENEAKALFNNIKQDFKTDGDTLDKVLYVCACVGFLLWEMGLLVRPPLCWIGRARQTEAELHVPYLCPCKVIF